MFSKELDMLIEAAIADGELTEKEREVLHKRAETEGIDVEEFDMILESRLHKHNDKIEKEKKLSKPSRDPNNSVLKKLQDNINNIVDRYSNEINALNSQELPYYKKNSASDYLIFNSEKEDAIEEAKRNRNNNIKGLIDNLYVCPTPEDVLELLNFLKPKTTSDYNCPFGSSVKEAYISKYNECLKIAEEKLSEEPGIKEYLQAIQNKKKKEKEKREKQAQQMKKNEELLSRQTLKRFKKDIKEVEEATYKGNHQARIKKRSKAVAAVIESFELPNDRDDLLEIMKFLKSYYNKKIWKDREDDYKREANAYRNKYIKSCELAKNLFPGDAEIEKEIIIKEKKSGFLGFLQSLGIDF